MKLIIFISDERGFAFNKRRQSKDAGVLLELCKMLSGKEIRIKEYSIPLFVPIYQELGNNNIVVCKEDFLLDARKDSYCFVDADDEFLGYADQIDEVYLLKWNRKYPSDRFMPEMAEFNNKLKLVDVREYVGSSHENIILEVWKNEEK